VFSIGEFSKITGLSVNQTKIFEFIHHKGYEPLTPSREIYHKGPGMIFKGNPRNYLTEIQVLIRPADGKW
jgi:effector-binding domain-containing protein